MRATRRTPNHTAPDRPSGTVEARGVGGRVVFNGRAVVIDRTHTDSFIVHGFAGPRVIPLHDLRAVRLRRSWAWFRGSLQFVRASTPRQGRGGAGDPDTVAFDARQQAQFETLVREVREALEDQAISVLVTAVDDPREAKRLASLHEHGLITEDEFQRLAARRKLRSAPGAPAGAAAARVQQLGQAARAARETFAERWLLPDLGSQARA